MAEFKIVTDKEGYPIHGKAGTKAAAKPKATTTVKAKAAVKKAAPGKAKKAGARKR